MTLEIGIPLAALAIFSIAACLGLAAGYALRPKSKPCAGDYVRRTDRFTEPKIPPFCVDCVRAVADTGPESQPMRLLCGGSFNPVTGEPGYSFCGDMRRQDCGTAGRYFKARKPENVMTSGAHDLSCPLSDAMNHGSHTDGSRPVTDLSRMMYNPMPCTCGAVPTNSEAQDRIAKGLSGDGPAL